MPGARSFRLNQRPLQLDAGSGFGSVTTPVYATSPRPSVRPGERIERGTQPGAAGADRTGAVRPAARDPSSGKWNLIGIFNQLGVARFPTQRPLSVYLKLSDAKGNYRLEIRFVQVSTGSHLAVASANLQIKERLASQDMPFRSRGSRSPLRASMSSRSGRTAFTSAPARSQPARSARHRQPSWIIRGDKRRAESSPGLRGPAPLAGTARPDTAESTGRRSGPVVRQSRR